MIDIVCHGTPPFRFLDEHLSYIEKRKKRTINKITFRNPDSVFLLQCIDERNRCIYRKNMHASDAYYRAFAVALDYRENCYQCPYARNERIADVTIGDYSGLGIL